MEDVDMIAVCRMHEMSVEEEEAEQLYYAAISGSITQRTFAILAKDLSRRSQAAGCYLAWLIYRGQSWPIVRGRQ